MSPICVCMVNDDAGDMSMSGIYPETPNIGHLRVDVGLQRLRGHPLVRGRLVAAAPVLGNLSGNMLVLLTLRLMLLKLILLKLMRFVG